MIVENESKINENPCTEGFCFCGAQFCMFFPLVDQMHKIPYWEKTSLELKESNKPLKGYFSEEYSDLIARWIRSE